MKKYIKILSIFALTFMGTTSAFAAVSDTFTAAETQAYTAEVKASITLEFDNNATDGDSVTIGDCVIHFNSGGSADSDCSDGSATLIQFDTAAHLNNGFDNLTNVSDNHNGHGALSISTEDGTHTRFDTAGAESADGEIYFSGIHHNGVSISSITDGVKAKEQKITFTPSNVSAEGGVKFTGTLGNNPYHYTTTSTHHAVSDIVSALQADMDADANFSCTEDGTKIECTANNHQNNAYNASVSDVSAPEVSGNIDLHVDENTTATAVTIPHEVTITDADPIITYHIHSTYKDHASFNLDEDTGELSFVNRPDYENPASEDNDNKYEIIVMVEDSSGNGHAVYVTIHLDDVDEAPVIGNANIGSRDEDLAVGSTLYDVSDFYTHNDNDGDGDPITYAITGGNTGNVFAIDSATGVVTLAAPLDYETTTNYHVTISGTSTTGANAALTGNGGFWMTVNDIPEASPSHHHRSSRRISKKKLSEIFNKAKDVVKEEVKEEVKEKTTPKCGFTYSRLLKTGVPYGKDVKALQEMLNSLGFNTGIADGWYGPHTAQGVRAFQNAMGIRVDGVFGPQSTSYLMQKCS